MTHALVDVAGSSDGKLGFDYRDMAKADMEDLEEQAGRITDLMGRV